MKDLKDIFGRYFFIAGYLPAVAFLALVRILVVPHLPDDWRISAKDLPVFGVDGDLALILLASLLFAALLVSLSSQIHRLFVSSFGLSRVAEKVKQDHNLWATELRKATDLLASAQERELRRALQADVIAAQKELRSLTGGALILDTANLKATRLGNLFAARDEYPERLYGMAMGIMWPRLLTVLPKEAEERIRSQNTSFMLLLNLAACLLLFTVLWALLGIASLIEWIDIPVWIWVGVLLVGSALIYPLYRLATSEAEVLVDDVKSAFDLYRGDLLKRYGIEPPPTVQEEAALWRQLGYVIALGDGRFYPTRTKTQDKEGQKAD